MKIAIIGAGNVGTSLGSGWVKAGHQIIYGVRNPQDEKARQLKANAAGVEMTTYADAARAAGGLEYARLLEPLAMLWIHLAYSKGGPGRDFALSLLRK